MFDIGKDLQNAFDDGYRQRDAEIVRCKDCKHYTLHCSWNGEKRYWCELDILHDGENGFCSCGAKMDLKEVEK